MIMKYKIDKRSFISTLYISLGFAFLFGVIALLASTQSYVKDTWQNYAEYNFEQEVEVGEDGEEIVYNLISTPEQLAGALSGGSIKDNFSEKIKDQKWDKYIPNQNPTPPNNYNNTTSGTDDYKGVTTLSNKLYRLTENIDLSGRGWEPKSVDSDVTIDGRNFEISNLTIQSSGCVGFVSENHGTIKNILFKVVLVENTSTDSSGSYVGVVAGINYGTIENVSVISATNKTGYVKAQDSRASGRLVGGIAGSSNGTIKHCSNSIGIQRGTHAGGIVGVSNGTVQNCYNYGSVSSGAKDCLRLGGIVGETSGGSVSLCLNFGSVSGSDSGDTALGGIVGYCNCNITECGNEGGVSSSSDVSVAYCGGIAGYLNVNNVSNCYNYGTISARAKSSSSTSAISHANSSTQIHYGGDTSWRVYVFYNQKIYDQVFYTTGPSNDTSFSTNRTSYTNYNAYAGGIVGYGKSKSGKVLNSYNIGSVSGGKVTYQDVYARTLSYAHSAQRVTMGVYTYSHSNSNRVYYDTYNYDYNFYYDPICGNSGVSVSNCCGTTSLPANKLNNYRHSNYYYSTSNSGFLAGGLIDLINLAIQPGHSSESNPGSLTSCDKTSHSYSDSKVVSGVSNLWHSFNMNTSNISVEFGFYCDSNRAYTLSSQSIIRKSFASSEYAVKTDSQMKESGVLSTLGSAWTLNGGYPYLKNMYW